MQNILAAWLVRIHGIGWAGDYDRLKFSRAVYFEQTRGGVFFRQMVVGLVSIIHGLANFHHYRRCLLLLAKARGYES